MLRLISIIGIAIAMVIGFVALSTKMKDDYSVRSRVVDVFKQMKTLAADELQCQSEQLPNSDHPSNKDQAQNTPDNSSESSVQMDADVELIPLTGEQASVESGMRSPEQDPTNSDTGDDTEQTSIAPTDAAQDIELEKNADIIKTMGYRMLDKGSVEVITIFNTIKGDSGKVQIKAGSRVVINCLCVSANTSCNIVESNINKNYLPKILSKQ